MVSRAILRVRLARRGLPVPSGMHIDQAGNLNQKNRLGRNVAIGVGVTAATLATMGAAGVGPMAGAFGSGGGAATGGAVSAAAPTIGAAGGSAARFWNAS